jgi:nucleoside-diphosphate-sugar epimerase
MRILVTGASGHVGGAIAAHLVQSGWQVTGLSRRGQVVQGAEVVHLDIGQTGVSTAIARRIKPCEAIVHAAASLEKELCAPSIALTNCLGTQELLKLASTWESRNFIYISSVPVIGLPRQVPVTEQHPVAPPTAYHASKLFSEHLVRLAGREGIAAASLRITAPVGPGMPPNRILPVFIRQAVSDKPIQLAGNGTRRQDYVDVRDIAMGVEQCLKAGARGLFNIAAGRAISNEDLARSCVTILKSNSRIEFSGKTDPEEGIAWEVSIALARSEFGYAPQHSLEDSIRALAPEYAYRAD